MNTYRNQEGVKMLIEESVVERALAAGEKLGSEYVEIRSEMMDRHFMECSNGTVTASTTRKEKGICARVLYNGTWGFSCTNRLKKVEETVINAYKSACSMSSLSSSSVDLAAVTPVTKCIPLTVKIPPSQMDIQEKRKLLRLEHELLSEYPHARHISLMYEDGEGITAIYTNEGTSVEMEMQYVWQFLSFTGKDSLTATVREEIGSVDKGWEFFNDQTVTDAISRLIRKMQCSLRGNSVEEQAEAIILGPQVAGLLVHEAIGHLLESDNFKYTGLEDQFHQQIAPDIITITDYSSIENGFGSIYIDDEGVPARNVRLIENGMLENILVNRENACIYNIEPTGNSRAEDFRSPPLVRMRNMVVEPADWTLEEMVEPLSKGYYCASAVEGEFGLDSSFYIIVDECYKVEKGEISYPIKNVVLQGNALRMLQKVSAVGKDRTMYPGRCKKRQTVPVGSGGPPILVKGGVRLGGPQ